MIARAATFAIRAETFEEAIREAQLLSRHLWEVTGPEHTDPTSWPFQIVRVDAELAATGGEDSKPFVFVVAVEHAAPSWFPPPRR